MGAMFLLHCIKWCKLTSVRDYNMHYRIQYALPRQNEQTHKQASFYVIDKNDAIDKNGVLMTFSHALWSRELLCCYLRKIHDYSTGPA